ncbi:potassium channel subfamily K member 18-like [Petromyzon marinus]|uniref:potassium channel subfamily K member 18-like n=1 Tax=Petromyzon marinus TaxID=7757 RepID=UPI003F725AA9
MVADAGERAEGAPSRVCRGPPCCGPGTRARQLLHHLAPHALLTTLLVLYALAGALAFSYLERPAEQEAHKNAIEEAQRTLRYLVRNIIDAVRTNACCTGEVWNSSTSGALEETLRLHLLEAGLGSTPPDQAKWSFMGALFFCCTIFTTIGYGNISPVTSVGKVLCMAYATLGIPIMLLVVADAGDLLAAGLTRLYTTCRDRCASTLERWRRQENGRGGDKKGAWEQRRWRWAQKRRSRRGGDEREPDGPHGADGPAGALVGENGRTETDGLLLSAKPSNGGGGAPPALNTAPDPCSVRRSGSVRSGDHVLLEYQALRRLRSLRNSIAAAPDETSLIGTTAALRGLRHRSPSDAVGMVVAPGGKSVVVELEEFGGVWAAPLASDGATLLRAGVGQRRLSEGGGVRPVAGARLERSRSWPGVTGVADAATKIRWIGELAEQLDVPVRLILATLAAYVALGALMMPFWEEWSYLDAFYFCFVTMTTIGLGDIVPSHPNYFLLISIYIVFGMAVMSAAFKLTQDRIFACYRRLVTSRHRLCRRCLACGSGPGAGAEG